MIRVLLCMWVGPVGGCSVVTFSTRREAEGALNHATHLNGKSLNLKWHVPAARAALPVATGEEATSPSSFVLSPTRARTGASATCTVDEAAAEGAAEGGAEGGDGSKDPDKTPQTGGTGALAAEADDLEAGLGVGDDDVAAAAAAIAAATAAVEAAQMTGDVSTAGDGEAS
jgi:hypothetical protein